MSAGKQVQVIERLLGETQQQIQRADTKAMACLQSVAGAGFAVLTLLTGDGSYGPLWWAGWIGWGIALMVLIAAVTPRLHGAGPPEQVAYFGDVVRLRDPRRIRTGIEAAAADALPGLLGQLRATSGIVMVKYRLTRAGLVIAAVSAVLIAVSRS